MRWLLSAKIKEQELSQPCLELVRNQVAIAHFIYDLTKQHDAGYVSVRWDNGTEEKAVFTGQNNVYYLVLAGDTAMDSNSGLHKQLLAQEVVKVCCNVRLQGNF